MKREVLFIAVFLSLLYVASLGFAQGTCDADVSVLNQDPYPAVPGGKLEIAFAISNIDSTDCGDIDFQILDEFPFSVAKTSQTSYLIKSGTFAKDYNTQKIIPVDFIVSEDAIDGNNSLEVRYLSSSSISDGYISKRFNINVEDVRADFEIFVSNYDYSTQEIQFDVLNIGKSNIEAVTVEVLKQEGVIVYGGNIENIGDLSSNEDTTADFKTDLSVDKINLKISYTDSINVRRTLEKEVYFDSTLFEGTKSTGGINYSAWGIGIVVILLILYFLFRRRKKK